MSKAKEESKDLPVNIEKNLPVNIEDEIRKQLQAQRGQLGALPSNKIGLRNKEFTLPDGQTFKTIQCVILDFTWFMVNYPGVYNSNAPQQPNCFAVGRDNPDGGNLKPHESAADPQHDNCKECSKNQWGSAHTGKGKQCKNQRRLVILPPDAGEDTEPMTMYVSPGGLKHFDAYVSRLSAEHNMLPTQVVTEITFDPDVSYPLLQFKLLEKHDNMNFFWAKREQAQEILFRPLETEKEKK